MNGYINALLRRSTKTLIVEGSTDKAMIYRLLSGYGVPSYDNCVVDQVDIIDDEELAGLGAKMKVKALLDRAGSLALKFPHLNERMGTLLDREWDGLDINDDMIAIDWSSPEQIDGKYVTVGHSIENYYFDVECVLGYLKFSFSHIYSSVLETTIRERFARSLALAGSFSSIARDEFILGRCTDLIGIDLVEFRDGFYLLGEKFISALTSRGFNEGVRVRDEVNAGVISRWSEISVSEAGRWIIHGHVGLNVLWSCIGECAKEVGICSNDANSIAFGYKQERQRYFNDWLANSGSAARYPLDEAASWLMA